MIDPAADHRRRPREIGVYRVAAKAQVSNVMGAGVSLKSRGADLEFTNDEFISI